MSLSKCIAPMTVSQFAQKYWGEKPLIVRHNCASYFSELISVRQLEDMIYFGDLRFPDFRLVKKGTKLEQYTASRVIQGIHVDGFPDPERIKAEHTNGATIVVQGRQNSWTPIADFVRDLQGYQRDSRGNIR